MDSYSRRGQQQARWDHQFYEEPTDDEGVYETKRKLKQQQHDRWAEQQMDIVAEDLSRQASEEFFDDHFDHMELMEMETLPDVAAIDLQTEIQWFMRPFLLDFLIEAHLAFQLLPETLFLTLNLLDRYCSKRVVYKRHYQLVGCCAMLIAAKYGDKKDRVPQIRELVNMCCGMYDEDKFMQMEWHILITLEWTIGHPTADSFLQMLMSECTYDPELTHMARFICEIATYHKEFVAARPSVMARSSLTLARHVLGRSSQLPQALWPEPSDVQVIVNLSQRLDDVSQVLMRKYSSSSTYHVATRLEEFRVRQEALQRQHVNEMPPTPPAEDSEMRLDGDMYSCPPVQAPCTPQKMVVPHNGPLTPPITPGSHDGHISEKCDPFTANDHAMHTSDYHDPRTYSHVANHCSIGMDPFPPYNPVGTVQY